MDDSPRSSKRRRLDTTKRIESSPLTKGPVKKASGRLTTRPASGTNGFIEEEKTPKRRGRPPKNVVKAIDIYDDIEGALNVKPSPKPAQRRTYNVSKADALSPAEGLQQAATTPKRGRGRPKAAESASRSAFKVRVKEYRYGSDGEVEIPEDLAIEVSTSSKRGRGARPSASSARKAPIPTSTGRRRVAIPAEEEDHEASETEDDIIHASPSKLRSARKPVSTSSRRRSNRTDHIDNRIDQALEEDETNDDEEMGIDGNSILESVLDPTEPSPFNKPTPNQKYLDAPPLIYGSLPAGRELDLLKTIALERITSKRPSPLVGLDAEYKSVHQIIEQTVTAGEGNSMLLIGARGSGKTALVNKVLSEVAKDNGGDYHIVRLNGFIHTDDKIALREIWRQLGKEMEIEEDGSGPGKNYADTLTTLLALLSHPSEQTGELTDQVAKAVIFIIDEFDLFAQHPRQTLLYNLFDIAQSRKAPIAVLGLTTRIDVTNSLEKRVKSRFSHRYVHLSLAKTFTAFQEICKACLIIHPEHLSIEERGILEGGIKSTPSKGTPTKKGDMDIKQDVLAEWNANINKLFASSTFLTQHLAPHFYRTKSIPAILNSFFLPTTTLSPDTSFAPSNTLNAPDSKLFLIPHLSTLSLSLLIAAARLDIIHDSDTCNFNMAYDEYVMLASKARIQSAAGGLSASGSVSKVWGKDVAKREWESLVELGLVMPVIQGQAGGFGMIRCDVALEEIGAVLVREKGIDKQLERWCKAI
ncbi:origin recognition complex subunit 4 C-terminus-domain-containing protein [Phaeosphaeriaceae sp. PMI808]|nr:origin recognition complex subunit 4 C-terminus-domain-containing protein [Phaeosphaeriaceae sp. PMI808]